MNIKFLFAMFACIDIAIKSKIAFPGYALTPEELDNLFIFPKELESS